MSRRSLGTLAPLILLPTLAWGVGCNAKAKQTESSSPPLARVGSEVLTEADLPAAMRVQVEQAERTLFQARMRGARSLTEGKLIAAAAKKKGATPEALEKELMMKLTDPTAEEVEEALKQPPYSQSLAAQVANARTEDEKVGARARVAALVSAKLRRDRLQKSREELMSSLRKEIGVEMLVEPPRLARASVSVEGAPSRGPASPPVTIVGFADFGPVYCQRGRAALEALRSIHKDEFRYVVKFYSSPGRPIVRTAAEAGACAAEQGKFWEFHDAYCAQGTESDPKPVAENAGLDVTALQTCLSSGKGAAAVEKDTASAKALGVTSSPAFLLNGIAVGPNIAEDMGSLFEIETLASAKSR